MPIWSGSFFFAPSPRHVSIDTALALGKQVDGRTKKVALTVDAGDDELASIIASLSPDMLQLHGRETPERVAAVRSRFGLPVMRAIGLRERSDLALIPAFDAVADHLLFDACPPADADRPGGNGEAFDWSLLQAVTTRQPWFLAGGLTPDNVALALAQTGAPGLDVSSGVETSPGVKDAAAIVHFVARAKDR